MNELEDIKEIRRANLKALVSKYPRVEDFAEQVDTSASYISQIFSEKTKADVGDRLARKIERALELPTFWMDRPQGNQVAEILGAPFETPDHVGPGFRPKRAAASDGAKGNLGKQPRHGVVWRNEDELDAQMYAFAPRMDMSIPCGDGKPVFHIDEKGQRQAFRLAYLQRIGANPATIATVTAEGQSMWPRIVHDDSLTIDYSKNQVMDDKVFVFIYRDNWFIKRLFRNPTGGLRVVSDNPDKSRYPDWFIEPEQMTEFQVIAKVLAVSGIVE